jgi:hypothetical protein
MQAAQKIPEARRVKFDELRRTLQYVEASWARRNEAYEFFSAACIVVFSASALYLFRIVILAE